MTEVVLNEASDSRIIPVILCGGSGTRLWPLSRKARPKQLLALTGPRTMLQMTLERVGDHAGFAPPIIVASADQADAVESQLESDSARLIVEPCARNTAPAIALAARSVEPDDLLLVMPSDHVIGNAPAFLNAVAAARPLAEEGWLVTFGITPTRAETGYGYIRRGASLAAGVFRADAFVEKPDAATAEHYLSDGGYDWNGGIFLFRADTFLAALAAHASDIAASVDTAMAAVTPADGPRLSPDADAFAKVRPQSVDHAVMEHADKVAVVPVEMDWSDIGSWQALHDYKAKDGAGTAAEGDVLLIDARNCLVRSDGPLVVAVGVEDLVIVATGDAVLVVPRAQSQRVQEVVARLKEKGDTKI
jgi:mannose-1-phosphate guanylyltransferase/mannose-1-phosphate guanylyltransferase/mannose-6-phosphate isomerase